MNLYIVSHNCGWRYFFCKKLRQHKMKNGQNNEDYPKNFNEDPKIFYSLFMVKTIYCQHKQNT